jgi:hypothetical protein
MLFPCDTDSFREVLLYPREFEIIVAGLVLLSWICIL